MAVEWQDGVSVHCCLSLVLDEDNMQGYDAGGGGKEERSVGAVRSSSRKGFLLLSSRSFLFDSQWLIAGTQESLLNYSVEAYSGLLLPGTELR